MGNEKRTFILDNGLCYTFFIAHTRDGMEVLAANRDNSTESDTIWTKDSITIPADLEDVQYALDNYEWVINQSRKLLENMKHFNLYWKNDSVEMANFLNDGKLQTWLDLELVVIDDEDNEGMAVYVDAEIDGEFIDLAEQYGLDWK
jgi:hypothetical protein